MRRMILPLMLFVFVACQPATMEFTYEQRAAIHDTVTQLADEIVEAFRARDIDRYMAPHASEFVFVENGVIGADRDSMMNAWGNLFATFQEITTVDWIDVYVDVLGPDAAVFTGSFDWTGVDTAGSQIAANGVWTTIWTRGDEGWKIIHGHESFAMPESM